MTETTEKKNFTLEKGNIILVLDNKSEPNVDFWDIWIKDKQFPIGYIKIVSNGKYCSKNVSEMLIYNESDRNKGYGSSSLKELANYYNNQYLKLSLGSSPYLKSSNTNWGVWINAGAKRFEIDTLWGKFVVYIF